ncbi:MAG: UDP-N-acetylglucosamine 1-carboxyvinyltransferase, partial [Bdellovibrionota bacterium]
MDKIRIRGGTPLMGSVEISGSKNASLPILISALLSGGKCEFSNIPNLQDIRTTMKLLEILGCEAAIRGSKAEIVASEKSTTEAPYDLVRTMRASVVVLGPLLARYGRAKVSLPGGCAIGARPINFHLSALEKLGAQFEIEQGYVHAKGPSGAGVLVGNRVDLEFPSVGATENVVMAATLARGESEITNCAKEPEIIDLAEALRAMGVRIDGAGTEVIRVQGTAGIPLKGCQYKVMAD